MNRIAATSAQNFASTDSAFGPCSAISARSVSGSITQASERLRAQMRLVGVLAGGVDDQEQMVAEIRHHQIVENAAGIVGELGVALPSRRDATMSCGTSRSSASAASSTLPDFGAQRDLAHMRDVEQAGAARVCRCSLRTPAAYCTGMS